MRKQERLERFEVGYTSSQASKKGSGANSFNVALGVAAVIETAAIGDKWPDCSRRLLHFMFHRELISLDYQAISLSEGD